MKKLGLYILAAIGFGTYSVLTGVDRDESGAIVEAGTLDAFQIRLGDCFDDPSYDAEEFTSLPGVPCNEPHDNEAFAVFDVSYPEYPEEYVLAADAQEKCVARFEGYVGRDYESSSLDVVTMYPSRESWAQSDREIVCAVYDMDGNKLVGSVKGQGI